MPKSTRVLAFVVLCLMPSIAPAEPSPMPERILFIGNSYTSQVRTQLTRMLADAGHEDTHAEFVTKGGSTLQRHLSDKGTLEKLRGGNWDIVVLQEQSQMPALPGKFGKSFQDSVDEFCKLIREAGAEPALYMTWGRRDGDAQNKKVLPDYEAMQKLLTGAYRKAAKRNKATIVPVGEAWSAVRKADGGLGKELYKGDGSHPSTKGACLVGAVFLRVLFDDSLESAPGEKTLTAREWKIIREAALEVK